jgi:hypothetical protein
MEQTDRKKFAQAIVKLSLIFPARLNKVQIEMYWDALVDYCSIGAFLMGCKTLVETRVDGRFPTPGEIRQAIRESPVTENATTQLLLPEPAVSDPDWACLVIKQVRYLWWWNDQQGRGAPRAEFGGKDFLFWCRAIDKTDMGQLRDSIEQYGLWIDGFDPSTPLTEEVLQSAKKQD